MIAAPLVVSCFEPFGGRRTNTSQRLLQPLLDDPPDGVATAVLPVDFSSLRRVVPRVLDKHTPRRWLLFGETNSKRRFKVERAALNVIATRHADNRGRVPRERPVERDGPAAYFTTLDVGRVRTVLRTHRVPHVLSFHAGTYACNQALYLALHHAGPGTEVGFVHVPRIYRRTGRTLAELRDALIDLAQTLSR